MDQSLNPHHRQYGQDQTKTLAVYKFTSTSRFPTRPGALQCVEACSRCHTRLILDPPEESAEIAKVIGMMSFDDLLVRKRKWFSKYQSTLYHCGQIEILRKAIKLMPEFQPVLYVVAAQSECDVGFLNDVLAHVKLSQAKLVDINKLTVSETNDLLTRSNSVNAIYMKLVNCVADSGKCSADDMLLSGHTQLMASIEDLLHNRLKNDPELDLTVVSVIVTKDHDKTTLYGIGSKCVQILEPISLRSHIEKIVGNTRGISTSSFIVNHLRHDLVRSAPILATHLVAFILLNADYGAGVSLDEIATHIDWFRRVSIHFSIQLPFTGSAKSIAEYALLLLDDYLISRNQISTARDHESLNIYARLVKPSIAPYGALFKAILVVYNSLASSEEQLEDFAPGVRVRVPYDDVVEVFKVFLLQIQQSLPCFRPCMNDIDAIATDVIHHAKIVGHFLTIQEPDIVAKRRTNRQWAGDDSEDDDYYIRRNLDALKSFILLTDRDYRLARMNLLSHSIEEYLMEQL